MQLNQEICDNLLRPTSLNQGIRMNLLRPTSCVDETNQIKTRV
ncbi:unnamed protein product [Arabidopsis halleri]